MVASSRIWMHVGGEEIRVLFSLVSVSDWLRNWHGSGTANVPPLTEHRQRLPSLDRAVGPL